MFAPLRSLRQVVLLTVPVLGFSWALVGGAPEHPPGGFAADVVLLHGLGRSDRAMRPLEAPLAAAGYRVHNLDYDSTDRAPEDLVAELGGKLATCCAQAQTLHFVTHSLGGILVRAYLAEHRPQNLGRVVMLAPPNHGSELVDILGGSRLPEWVLGPTGAQLGTDEKSLPNRLPPPDYEVGVIAGRGKLNPLGSVLLPGESDGTVTVESTRLEGMTDFVTVDHSHTFIMRSDQVAEQVGHFLRKGRFRHDPEG